MNIGYGKVHACPKHVSSIHLRMMLNLARPRGKDMVKRVDLAINCCVCCQKMDRKAVHVGSSMPSSLTSHKELNSSNKLANHDTPAGFCYHLRQMMIHNDPYMPQLCMLKKGGNFWFSPLLYLEKRCVCFTFFFSHPDVSVQQVTAFCFPFFSGFLRDTVASYRPPKGGVADFLAVPVRNILMDFVCKKYIERENILV